MRAFDFTKDGTTWVVFWHAVGAATLNLPLSADDVALYDEFAGKPVAVAKTAEGVSGPVGKRLYMRLSCSREKARKAFASASLSDGRVGK